MPTANPEVADAVDEERLLRRLAGGGLLVVVADQQVAAQPHALPPEVEHDEVLPHDQVRHGEDEQPQVREEPPVADLALHVPGGEDRDEEPDPADDAEHHGGQRVEERASPDVEEPAVQPSPVCPAARARRQPVGLRVAGGDPGEPRRGVRLDVPVRPVPAVFPVLAVVLVVVFLLEVFDVAVAVARGRGSPALPAIAQVVGVGEREPRRFVSARGAWRRGCESDSDGRGRRRRSRWASATPAAEVRACPRTPPPPPRCSGSRGMSQEIVARNSMNAEK